MNSIIQIMVMFPEIVLIISKYIIKHFYIYKNINIKIVSFLDITRLIQIESQRPCLSFVNPQVTLQKWPSNR